MKRGRLCLPLVAVVGTLVLGASGLARIRSASEDRVRVSPQSDARAVEIAGRVVERMGGWEAWDRTRFLRWRFFGRRSLWWDRHEGRVRIEADSESGRTVWLLDVNALEGRVWTNGEEIVDPDELRSAVERGHQIWINDSYWLIMPFKLLDPGVTLRYAGQRPMDDGTSAHVLELTFGEDVGYTPDNRYEVFVGEDSGLVEAWSFYAEASDEKPRFTLPWAGWKRFGRVLIATDHGRGHDWAIAAPEALPDSVFESPAPVIDP